MAERAFTNNCPVRERTADGVSVGRCWCWCVDNRCPRHGDVTVALQRYRETGKLTDDHVAKAGASCEHDQVQPGPDLPRLYGSWASEVCSRCGAWRTMGHVNRSHLSEWKTGPMPVDEDRP